MKLIFESNRPATVAPTWMPIHRPQPLPSASLSNLRAEDHPRGRPGAAIATERAVALCCPLRPKAIATQSNPPHKQSRSCSAKLFSLTAQIQYDEGTSGEPMKEIDNQHAWRTHLQHHTTLENIAVQGLDLRPYSEVLRRRSVRNSFFLGCQMDPDVFQNLIERSATCFPAQPELPFNPFRGDLYTGSELMHGYERGSHQSFAETLDGRIYEHYQQSDQANVLDTLYQRLHDHAIDDAVSSLLSNGRKHKTVGIMGGHSLTRDDDNFTLIAKTAWRLTKAGYFISTGGGPGAMEAGNLGAYLSEQPIDSLMEAIELLKTAPTYRSAGWFDTALEVLDRYPEGASSLGVPTWFYGHEPSNLFASHIAKYFANSVRRRSSGNVAGGLSMPKEPRVRCRRSFRMPAKIIVTCDVVSPMVFLGSQLDRDLTRAATHQGFGG